MVVVPPTIELEFGERIVDALQVFIGKLDTGRLGIFRNSTRVARPGNWDVLLIRPTPLLFRYHRSTHIRRKMGNPSQSQLSGLQSFSSRKLIELIHQFEIIIKRFTLEPR